MQIGIDAVVGEPEFCVHPVGLGVPVGNCVAKDSVTGRFVSAARVTWALVQRAVQRYTETEPVELERRPTPRRARAPLAEMVAAVALVVVASRAPGLTVRATVAVLASAALSGLASYTRREVAGHGWMTLGILAPSIAFLVWVWSVVHVSIP